MLHQYDKVLWFLRHFIWWTGQKVALQSCIHYNRQKARTATTFSSTVLYVLPVLPLYYKNREDRPRTAAVLQRLLTSTVSRVTNRCLSHINLPEQQPLIKVPLVLYTTYKEKHHKRVSIHSGYSSTRCTNSQRDCFIVSPIITSDHITYYVV